MADLLRLAAASLLCLILTLPCRAEPAQHAADALLERARGEVAGGRCGEASNDALRAVLCRGRLRVGVRTNYPGFGEQRAGAWAGYEVDLARALAERLGTGLELVGVTPATRIAMLLEGRIDIVIATMGHTLPRDGQVRFVRPHYYRSQTIIIGDRRLAVKDLQDLGGRTVCVPLGNADTTRMAGDGARLLIFDNPRQMIDALRMDICTLAMHDDSFFAEAFSDPAFRQRFEPKLVVSSLPWGMATAREDDLARLLDLQSITWHAQGLFLATARRHAIDGAFLAEQEQVWHGAACTDEGGYPRASCLAPPSESPLVETSFAASVERFEEWVRDRLGVRLLLPMLKSEVALDFFLDGIAISLILVVGSLVATSAAAVAFAAGLCAETAMLRRAVQVLTGVLQCSPLVLLLFFGYALVSTVVPYSTNIALILAILMIGLYNGSHAGRAIADAHAVLRARSPGKGAGLAAALPGASTQIISFLVNATKSSSVASMIGVPELLNALTDITSFTSERMMTYTFLLIFYSSLVLLVVWAARRAERAWRR
jgi:ABC-type amino acid transport substrate-binding protein/ABC-type amino acid transport system permease subunit